MGLSQPSRVRNTVAQIRSKQLKSFEFAPTHHDVDPKAYALALASVQRAVRHQLWLKGMQKQLQHTTQTLRKNPSAAIAAFQKTLNRPSYFYSPTRQADWVILLGPRNQGRRPSTVAAKPKLALVARKSSLLGRMVAALRQWLMQPIIDTREPA
jgi:hypothetical protein